MEKNWKSIIQSKPFLILLNIEFMFPYSLSLAAFFKIYLCRYMGIREKEGKEKEETGAALPPQIVWNIVSKYPR